MVFFYSPSHLAGVKAHRNSDSNHKGLSGVSENDMSWRFCPSERANKTKSRCEFLFVFPADWIRICKRAKAALGRFVGTQVSTNINGSDVLFFLLKYFVLPDNRSTKWSQSH